MRTNKYTAKIVNIASAHILNETGQVVNGITSQEKLLHSIAGDDKYSYVELYTCLSTITGNTLKELDKKATTYAETNNMWDFSVIIISK